MTRLTLPALRSDDTLGFLAALGVVELCTTALQWDVRLGWEGLGGQAVLDAPVADLAGLADALVGVATGLRDSERLIPAADPGLIPKALSTAERNALGVGLDPLKLPPPAAITKLRSVRELDLAGQADARWLCAVIGQCAPSSAGPERRLTPLYAPSGQMTVFQLFRDARDEVLKRPASMLEAVQAWRRTKGTGANLDARALIDGAQASGGKAANMAVPGASWLALQSFPWFTQTGDGVRGDVAGWRRGSGGSALHWPVWTPPLDPAAVRVLLTHPALDDASPDRLRALGVVGICTARRRALSKSAGALMMPHAVRSVL